MSPPIFQPSSATPYQYELRQQLLAATLPVAIILAVLYLLAGAAGLLAPRLFPWDGLGFLIFCLLAWTLYRWRKGEQGVAMAASWLVAAVNVLAALNSQVYGIQHPVTALYLPGIILAGMLIGGWFLPLWTAFGALFILGWGLLELNGIEVSTQMPLETPAGLIQTVGLWWGMLALTGWLAWLLARNLERAVQLSRGQTATLTQILDAITHTAALDVILHRVLAAITGQLRARWVSLLLYEPAGQLLRLRLAYSDEQIVSPEKGSAIPAGTDPLWQAVVENGRAIVMNGASNHPHHPTDTQTILLVPLKSGEVVTGYFNISGPESRQYGREDLELASALAQLATLALQLTDLARQLQEAAVTGERNRMAQEIHDSLAQGLTGIIIQLEAAEDVLDGEPAVVQSHLERARTLARESLAEARRSVWALRPQVLEETDLPGALQRLSAGLQAGRAPIVRVEITGEPFSLSATAESELLRIAQEALNNAVKHAVAETINLSLAYRPDGVELRVVDNGRGFEANAPGPGYGLTTMRERAARIGASLTIDSTPAGTIITCYLAHSQQATP